MTQIICLTSLRSFKHLTFKPSYVLRNKPDDNCPTTRNFSVSSELRAQCCWGTPPQPCEPPKPPPPCPPPPSQWPLLLGGLFTGAATIFLIDKYCEFLKAKEKKLQADLKIQKYCRQRFYAILGVFLIILCIALDCLFNDRCPDFGPIGPKKGK
ncbi:hypothetical protein O0L34_g16495 [Tuta absoluta]|nr:hypothetical protein O0L34_g16495 [Tuta absoluta]